MGFDCRQLLSSFMNLGCIISLNSKSLYIEGISWLGSMTYFSSVLKGKSVFGHQNSFSSSQLISTAKHNKKGKQGWMTIFMFTHGSKHQHNTETVLRKSYCDSLIGAKPCLLWECCFRILHLIMKYLLNRLSMMAFSVHRSSAGRELACQRSRSSALERYSVLAMSVRNCNKYIHSEYLTRDSPTSWWRPFE